MSPTKPHPASSWCSVSCARQQQKSKGYAGLAYARDSADVEIGTRHVNVSDIVNADNVQLEEDTYGMMVCSLMRDAFFFSHGEEGARSRTVRMFTVIFLLLFTIFMQVWLLAKVKQFVSAKQVHDSRIIYGEFEKTMCGENTTLSVNGEPRCLPGAFPELHIAKARLATLSEIDQGYACRIPLSQPYFFATLLLMWTLTCVAELRNAFALQFIVLSLRTIKTMKDAHVKHDDDDFREFEGIVITGMTMWMKVLITICTFVPRTILTCYLLWVGCRFLLGTNVFADLLLNALALEFVLRMKESIYVALMPLRSKRDRELTSIHPVWRKVRPTVWTFVNSLGLLVVAVVWVFAYMYYFQAVLPDYRWDVHAVCSDYISREYEI